MNYQINPVGGIWSGGMFSVPMAVADTYIKLASEYQIKALLFILSRNGVCTSAEIARKFGMTMQDAENIMDFWVAEGIVAQSNNAAAEHTAEAQADPSDKNDNIRVPQQENKAVVETAPKKSTDGHTAQIKAPTLSPKEIVDISAERQDIAAVLNEAQKVYGRSISHSEQETLVNLVSFYGMAPEVVLMLLAYCKSRKDAGFAVSAAYFYWIAQNWLEDGIDNVDAAEERICELERTDIFWERIKEAAELVKKAPTETQRKMISGWQKDFSEEMIFLAISIMRENIDKPDLRYVDKLLKNWKKTGIKTPQDAETETARFEKKKEEKEKGGTGTISRKPTYDLEKIKNDAHNNTDIKY